MDDIHKDLTKVFVIRNPDNSIRWVLPTKAKKPLFLAFYAITDSRSFLISLYFRVIFILGLKRLFLKCEELELKLEVLKYLATDLNESREWAMFMGTTGPNNKRLLYFKNEKNEFSFVKIATTKNAESLIQNEAIVLSQIEDSQPKHFLYPTIEGYKNSNLRIPDLSVGAKRCQTFTSSHFSAVQELSKIDNGIDTSFNDSLEETDSFFKSLSSQTEKRFPKSMIRKTSEVVQYLKNYDLKMTFSHGDLTPWNCYLKQDKLAIYDWELAKKRVKGFDLFHFIIQKNILLTKKSWKDTYREVNQVLSKPHLVNDWPELSYISDFYLAAYLVAQIYESTQLYSAQEKWHAQVYWMFDFWNEALSDLLGAFTNYREVLLKDTLDFLSPKQYAGIKVQNQPIEHLNEYSDIDWCINKVHLNEIIGYLTAHPAVSTYKIQQKSFMATLHLLLKDDSTLNYDFVWQFKVKGLEFLNQSDVLSNRELNGHGIYVLSALDTARYICLFYYLNGENVPKKYQKDIAILENSRAALDLTLAQYKHKSKHAKAQLELLVQKNVTNRGIKGFRNKFNYYLDTVRSFFGPKGFLVTFSGVDGAGKSTIIEEFKMILEKKYRRRVVVIRHRPSILPILSVWTKGKKKAHEDVINALPRQGQNKSKWSSLLRFSYYYTDYLFGQFYVYFRYALLGYIVLYDRYYFDFINDSKRSNLTLSPSIVKMGYLFLMQPKFNFFLYADAKVIRERKKELEEEDIRSLTSSYLSLFEKYNKSKSSNYVSLNNIKLRDTLSTIEKETLPHL